jgi:two-component system, NtrC family, sensor kinase
MRPRSSAGGGPAKKRRKAATVKPPKVARRRSSSAAGQETNIALLNRELNEALERQKATAEVLSAVSRSKFELQPILQSVVDTASRLCRADVSVIFRLEGGVYRFAAGYSLDPAYLEHERRTPISPGPGTVVGRAAMMREVVKIEDAWTDPLYEQKVAVKIAGGRSMIGVPLMREGEPIGVMGLARIRVEPFAQREIELVTTFADQAVIAIENARLVTELRESLEQQTATAEVLSVISSSPGDLTPVFEAMLTNAAGICDARFGGVYRWDGEFAQLVATTRDLPPAYAAVARYSPFRPDPEGLIGRSVVASTVTHIADMMVDDLYTKRRDPFTVAGVELGGMRTALVVPMLRDNEPIGFFALTRHQVRPFTDKQIDLIKNFAAQAVIAIENARLLNELRERTDDLSQRTTDLTEALEQQTATSEVLRVISSSSGDLEPAFAAMLENAVRICDANFGNIYLWRDDALDLVAVHNTPHAFAEARRRSPIRPPQNPPVERMIATKTPIHSTDLTNRSSYTDRSDPGMVMAVELGGVRTALHVPMFKENELVGSFALYRQEPRSFSDKQIELVKNFAAQAVIAIENARLLNELRQRTDDLTEALDQQTATSDVLQVISRSPGDLQPVFESVLANATQLCGAAFGNLLLREDDKHFRFVALHNAPPALAEFYQRESVIPVGPDAPLLRAATAKVPVQVRDFAGEAIYKRGHRAAVALVELGGARTFLVVPLLKEGEPIGGIAIYRQEVRPFGDKQIELVQNFAAQAVIAIENARLLNELRQRTADLTERTADLTESLDQQTATSEVLQTISSSPGDLRRVFATMLERAVRLSGAKFGNLFLREGDAFRTVAMHNAPPAYAEARMHALIWPGPDTALGRISRTKRPAQIEDVRATSGYMAGDPFFVSAAELSGVRTMLAVPMLRNDQIVGSLNIYRQEVMPFNRKQIDIISNFAAQAVIAIENARLLNELRQRTADLTEALEQQTATSDVLRVISSSPGELGAVFNKMLDNAIRICDAKFGTIDLKEGDGLRLVAAYGVPPAFAASRGEGPFHPAPGGILDTVMNTARTVHIQDLAATHSYIERHPRMVEAVEVAGIRTAVGVPMLRDDELIGIIAIFRREVSPFTEKQIELLSNFAAQAVIAIENARLLNELRESLEQQTATSEVLRVISSSPGELTPVFQVMLENATRICSASFGTLLLYERNAFRRVARHNVPQVFTDRTVDNLVAPFDKAAPLKQLMATKQLVHITDIGVEHPDDPIHTLAGARTILLVPMLKDDELVGVFAIYRQEVRSFTDKEIALVTNFAAQAVIAVENARLLNELRQRTDDLTKSLEDLRTTQDRLVQTQKLASLGQLTAGIAHEIKNPLNFVNNFSGVSAELIDELREALDRMTGDDKTRVEITELSNILRDNLNKIVQHGKRADSIVKNMLLHSREGSGEHRLVDVNALVEESVNLAYHGARAENQSFNINMERSLDPAAGMIDVFPQEITRALLNLISNGLYAATKRRGQDNSEGYEPTLKATTKNLGNRVEIRIRDNGTGIPAEVKEKMFNPFFTTKPAGEGTGLGLSITHDIIVKQHSGLIEVDSQPGEYTEVRIVLPRATAFIEG